MSDDKQLTIRVSTRGEPEGAKQVADSLSNLTDKTHEAGEKNKIFAGHMGEVKKAIRELGQEFPIAGLALRAFVSPIGAAIGGAITVFALFKKSIEDTNKALDESAAKAARPEFAEGIQARKKAMDDAAISAAEFADKLAHVTDAETQFQDAIKNSIDLLHEQTNARSSINNAQEGFDLEALEQKLKRGLISQQQYYAAVYQIKSHYRELELQNQMEDDARTVALQEQALAHAKNVQTTLEAAAKSAQDTAKASSGKFIRDSRDQTEAIQKDPELKKAFTDSEAKLAPYGGADRVREILKEGTVNMGFEVAHPLTSFKDLQKMMAEFERASREYNENLNKKGALEKNVPNEEFQAKADDRAMGRAENAAIANKERIDQLTTALDKLRESLTIKEGVADIKAKIENKTDAVRAGFDIQGASKDAEQQILREGTIIARIAAAGGKLSDQQISVLNSVAGMISGHEQTTAQSIALLARSAITQEQFQADLDAISSRMGRYEGRMKALGLNRGD